MRLKLVVLLMLLSSVMAQAQDWVTMTGVVTDKKNTPIVGVIILENGIQTGVMTNAKGIYSITTTPGSVVEFKFLGFNTVKKKAVEGEVNIKMKPDAATYTKLAIGITGGGVATEMLLDLTPATPYYVNGFGGAFLTINPTKWLGLKAGANYMLQGGNFLMPEIYVSNEPYRLPITFEQTTLNIPVSLVITPFKLISLEAGVYQNILLDSKFIEQSTPTFEITPDQSALEYNIGALVGASINLGRTFFINARYYQGRSWYYAMNGKGYMTNALTMGIGINLIKVK